MPFFGGGGGGSGTVESVSVVTANGLSGTVADPTTTPAITLDISALDATKIADGTVTNAEFQFINTLSSNAQTQLNAKASTALSNLASVAINTTLVSDTDNTDDLGTSGVKWKTGYFGTSVIVGGDLSLTNSVLDFGVGGASFKEIKMGDRGGAGTATIISNGGAGETILDVGRTDGPVRISGTGLLTNRIVTAKTTDYPVVAADKNTFFTNTGAGAGVIFTLPTPVVGMTYEFTRTANQAVTVDVTAGITIQIGASVTTSGGNVTLDAVGSRIRIVAVSTTQWFGDLSGAATFN